MTDEIRDLFGEVVRAFPARIGRRLHLPAWVRARAEDLARQGASAGEIAVAIGVSESTARTRLRVELERGWGGARNAGRPHWRPSAAERAKVERLAGAGVVQEEIALAVGVSGPTLRLHCRAELDRGRAALRTRNG